MCSINGSYYNYHISGGNAVTAVPQGVVNSDAKNWLLEMEQEDSNGKYLLYAKGLKTDTVWGSWILPSEEWMNFNFL